LFLHFGLIHLALNMWALWDVGRLMEQLLGRWRFALLYLGSGVMGNLLSLVVQGNVAVSGGASGAIFSLYGALLVFLWRERRQVERGEFRWFFGAAIVFTVFALVMGQLVPGIDNAAHIGGLIAGALAGGVLLRPWTPRSPPLPAMRPAAAGLLVLAGALLVGNIPAPTYLLGNELQAREAIRQFLDEDRRVSQQWESMLDRAVETQLPFDHLAVQVDSIVTTPYQESLDQLSALHLQAAAPSARTLDMLLRYASLRTDASQAFSDALRKRDPQKIREALEKARSAPQRAQALPALTGASALRPPASAAWP
jgi:rhomboid protease GluP